MRPPMRIAMPRTPSASVSRGGADQVVGVNLLRHLLEGARAADDDRESQNQHDRRAPEHRQGPERP